MVCVLLPRTKIKNEASSWHLGQKWQITKRSPGWTDAIHYNRVHILSRFCFVCLYTMPIGYLYFWVTRKRACKRCFLCQIIYRKMQGVHAFLDDEHWAFWICWWIQFSFHFGRFDSIQGFACIAFEISNAHLKEELDICQIWLWHLKEKGFSFPESSDHQQSKNAEFLHISFRAAHFKSCWIGLKNCQICICKCANCTSLFL